MAKKSPRKARRAKKSSAESFSLKGLHTALSATLQRLQAEEATPKQRELVGLVRDLQRAGFCGQNMLIDLGV